MSQKLKLSAPHLRYSPRTYALKCTICTYKKQVARTPYRDSQTCYGLAKGEAYAYLCRRLASMTEAVSMLAFPFSA